MQQRAQHYNSVEILALGAHVYFNPGLLQNLSKWSKKVYNSWKGNEKILKKLDQLITYNHRYLSFLT